jgi:hypothetical protein
VRVSRRIKVYTIGEAAFSCQHSANIGYVWR